MGPLPSEYCSPDVLATLVVVAVFLVVVTILVGVSMRGE